MIAKSYIWTTEEYVWLVTQGMSLDTYIGQPVKLPTVRRTRPIKKRK